MLRVGWRAGIGPDWAPRAVAGAGLVCLLASLAVMLWVTVCDPMKDDVAWLLYVAQQWLHGQKLYVDLVEVNPPLIIWMYAVPVILGRWCGVAAGLLAMPLFAVVILSCAFWTATLLTRGRSRADWCVVFSVIGCVLLLMPGAEFGQREHLLIAMALPYLALVGSEICGSRTGRWQAIGVGVVAAIGCAIKPRYLFAFGLVELFACWQGVRLLRPVSLAAAATLALYALAVLIFAPAFYTEAVPMALSLYGATDSALSDLLFDCRLLFLGVTTGLLLLTAHRGERGNTVRLAVIFIFAAGATLVCVIEAKNWFYHQLPGVISSVLGLLGLVAWLAKRPRRRWAGDWRTIGLAGLVVLTLLEFGVGVYQRLRPEVQQALDNRDSSTEERLARIIRHEKAHSYLALSEWIALGFPVVNETGVVWASRFDSMWALRAGLGDAGLAADWPVAKWVVEDFLHTCPDLVVVDLRAPANYLALLGEAPGFRKAWKLYRPITAFDRLVIFRNRANQATRLAAGCGVEQQMPVAVAGGPQPSGRPPK